MTVMILQKLYDTWLTCLADWFIYNFAANEYVIMLVYTDVVDTVYMTTVTFAMTHRQQDQDAAMTKRDELCSDHCLEDSN